MPLGRFVSQPLVSGGVAHGLRRERVGLSSGSTEPRPRSPSLISRLPADERGGRYRRFRSLRTVRARVSPLVDVVEHQMISWIRVGPAWRSPDRLAWVVRSVGDFDQPYRPGLLEEWISG